MLELKTLVEKLDRRPTSPGFSHSPEPKQRRMMITALALLLAALAFVLYHDRDFWFPETQEAQANTQPQPATPAARATPTQGIATNSPSPSSKRSHTTKPQAKASPPSEADPASSPDSSSTAATVPPISVTRTVLPPLEVEVVAGNVHRTLHPGANSVHVDLQPTDLQDKDLQKNEPQANDLTPAEATAPSPASSAAPDTAAGALSNAAERVQMSADTDAVVSTPVKPGYPLLARQMKVQGSVILQALIGRNGLIQDLRVISGPPILASAAQEAVKQWHFKPHFQGPDAVETQARITVNFTISTN